MTPTTREKKIKYVANIYRGYWTAGWIYKRYSSSIWPLYDYLSTSKPPTIIYMRNLFKKTIKDLFNSLPKKETK